MTNPPEHIKSRRARMQLWVLIPTALLIVGGCTSSKGGKPVDPATVDCHDPNLTQAQYMAACGPSHLSTETSTPAVTSSSSSSPSVSADHSYTYPNGGKVSVSEVKRVAASRCSEIKPTETCILIQVSITNVGAAPIVLGDTQYLEFMQLFYGANQYKAESDGFQGDPDLKTFPRQCVPGSTVITGEIYKLPTSDLNVLLVNFQSPLAADTQAFPPHPFPDVQTLLH